MGGLRSYCELTGFKCLVCELITCGVYGLTEVYGPAVVNEWHGEWDKLDAAERAAKKARQGVRYAALEGLAVLDPITMAPVPA